MAAIHDSETNMFNDLTAEDVGDISLWIGKQKEYRDVPNYVSNELCQRSSMLPSVLALLPSGTLPVLQLLELATPQVAESLQCIEPKSLFGFHEATHTSLECLQLPVPSSKFLNQLQACAGQAMLDGKMSIQHWERREIFLPFDALGTWAHLLEIDTAKRAWIAALYWLTGKPQNIPEQYILRIKSLLIRVPWKGYIQGLGSALTITDMSLFLSREWLSDLHIYTMLAVTRRLHHDALYGAVPCTELASPDFPSHILTSPLLATTPIAPDYFSKAPKSVIALGTTIANALSGIRVAAIAFSPPGHWACLLIDSCARTISWGDSAGFSVPAGFEDRLRAWLALFIPQTRFLPLQELLCAHQTDSYSCGIIAVNTLKHHIFGDNLWTPMQREILRIHEFLDIMEFSEHWRAPHAVSLDLFPRMFAHRIGSYLQQRQLQQHHRMMCLYCQWHVPVHLLIHLASQHISRPMSSTHCQP